MHKLKITAIFLFILIGIGLYSVKGNSSNPENEKIEKLLRQMTLEEKVGQMTQVTLEVVSKGEGPFRMDKPWALDHDKLKDVLINYHVGSILNTAGEVRTPEEWYKVIKTIQDVATNDTRLKIPVLYGIDAIHGMYSAGATMFPQEISMAASWNPELVKKSSEIIAYETRACGIPWTFNPTLDLGIDPRWPRMWEAYGEDPYLQSIMGTESVKGYEGGAIDNPNHVASCLKHYIGYGAPRSGKDRTPAWIPETFLREYFLPPFEAAVQAGAKSVMVNSGEVNGVPVHASKKLLTDILRGELGFEGVIVTDWFDINNLVERHHIAANKKEAVKKAILAGIDMSMVPYDVEFSKHLVELVKEGQISEERIDASVRRILKLKFELNLFENPYTDYKNYPDYGGEKHHQIARQSAHEVITLLKNENNILPLKQGAKILVTGPNANSMRALNGGWTYTWQGEKTNKFAADHNTIVEALKAQSTNIFFEEGVRYPEGNNDYKVDEVVYIDKAVKLAKNVDYILLCLGENSYTEKPGDLDDLTLSANQLKLAEAMIKTKKPVILVLNEGRPRVISSIEDQLKAVIQLYLPGNEGGNALADILYGKVNPSGKLPYTYPRFVNDLLPYYHKFSSSTAHNDGNINNNHEVKAQYEFGFGLSYTTFKYEDLKLSKDKISTDDELEVSIKVTNTGQREGKEVVQLYTTDIVASISPSVKRLRRFEKINLKAGESKTVSFKINKNDLSFIGEDNKPVVEAGEFIITCGSLQKKFHLLDSKNL
ncbi:glycoside hydrolase family 3 N-terminal domain-containing protein [Flammeovirga sp. EKP202]|uniref:glycoside hydrolase family 3 N-terminal domain-containing protein n=1 Tax=Flammeovirga sp. EKP202 TaxID=2770592 RepID=UPI00165EC05A|nr:glycoside hydrolase family 3 N-terminal domain-containing protein [Flammeovirga sp. EKP202]MBD0401445.1 glycoside hydrolase family 3 C-terminal domain-containing protein [Flammeovirga sp. EKP202]